MHKKIIFGMMGAVMAQGALAGGTITVNDVFTNSGRTIKASKVCADCCGTDCWFRTGTYYDSTGTFRQTCTGDTWFYNCRPDGTYSASGGKCTFTPTCSAGLFWVDGMCVDANSAPVGWAYLSDTYEENASDYDLEEDETWAVELDDGNIIKGSSVCSSRRPDDAGHLGGEFTSDGLDADGDYCYCTIADSPREANYWVHNYLAECRGDDGVCTYMCEEYFYTGDMDSTNFRKALLWGYLGRPYCNTDGGYYDIGFKTCVFTESPYAESPNGLRSEGWNHDGYIWNSGGGTGLVSIMGLSGPGTWAVEFEYGTIRGQASCNATAGGTIWQTTSTSNFSNTSVTGDNCWCKMTEPGTSYWVFRSSRSECEITCAEECAIQISGVASRRKVMYSTVTY